MSDETPPPSLRLKPRQRTDAEAPPAAPAPEAEVAKPRLKPKLTTNQSSSRPPMPIAGEPAEAPAPAAPAAASPAPTFEKIRLRPKINPEPASAPQEAAAAPAEPPPEEAPAAPPPLPPPEEPKVKLKIRIPGSVTEAAQSAAQPAAPSPSEPPVEGTVPPPFPNLSNPPIETKPAANPARPGAPKPGAPVRRPPTAELVAVARKKRIFKLLLVGAGSLILAAGIITFAMYKFIDAPSRKAPVVKPPAPVEKPVVETPVAAEPPQPEAAAEPAPTPGPATAHPGKAPRLKSGETNSKATTALAPGLTVTTEAVQAEIEASEPFRTFVADAKVSGVYQGTPPRAFINGRLVRAGETVDSFLGIKFESADPATKTIVFKDSTGATVSKRY